MEVGCGIYGIQNKINGTIYVGSSKNLYSRLKNHESRLRHGKHINEHLQRACSKYGIDNFLFFVIEFVPQEDLLVKETEWISHYKDIDGVYNVCLTPVKTNSGIHRSDEFRSKVSEGLKRMWDSGVRKKRVQPVSDKPKDYVPGSGKHRTRVCKTYYNLLSPDGVLYPVVTNLGKFAKEHRIKNINNLYTHYKEKTTPPSKVGWRFLFQEET